MTKMPVLISICIPAYKNITYLKRLLDSITIQTFKNYEVIVTDDSPDDTVGTFLRNYTGIPALHHYRNSVALGTPENWNEGIRRAKGEWIKLMHDDDWFSLPDSLQHFADAVAANQGDFIFSAYTNVFLKTGRQESVTIKKSRKKALTTEPATLFSSNVIGPPSVILHRNDQRFFYDRRTKWVVDIDFYIRRLAVEKIHYIDIPLINVGMSDQQVTMDCIGNRQVQIPENFHLLNKVGIRRLNNLLVYDAWWRLMRNLEVTRASEIREAGYQGTIHPVILSMVRWQARIPRPILVLGAFSKIAMFAHYLTHKNLLRH